MHELECYFFLHPLHQNSCLVFVKKNYTRNREYFGTRWRRGKVLCVYSKHNNGKARSRENHGASPSLWKEYYLKTRQTIQVGSGKLNTSREKHF
jgi:hypothetical protein